MNYFRKMDVRSIDGRRTPVHCREFYLEKIAYQYFKINVNHNSN